LYSTDYITTKTGTWNDDTVWNLGTFPNSVSDNAMLDNNDSIDVKQNITISLLTFKNNSILYIAPGYTLTVDSMSILNNAILYVEGSLTVTGGVAMANNSSLDVDLSGGIDIGGDFNGGQNVDITIDGSMDVAGDLNLGTGSEVDGNGDINVEGEIDIPAGSDPGVVINPPLPIKLVEFFAYKNLSYTTIIWTTYFEINNEKFILEYSNDALLWNHLSEINGNGNSNSIIKYDYIHNTDQNFYYRLTQIDYDGKSETFNIINTTLNLNIESLNSMFYLYDLNGRLIDIGEMNYLKYNINPGLYIIREIKKYRGKLIYF